MSRYIQENTKKRIDAQDVFSNSHFKLYINGNFGKSMDNVKKRVNVRLLSLFWRISKRQGNGEYILKVGRFISQNLSAIEINKTSIYYNKPIYAGFSILEINEMVM